MTLSLQEQQAKLLVLLPQAIATLKATALATAPEVGLTERIGFIEGWDSFVLAVEVILDWEKGSVEAVGIRGTWTFWALGKVSRVSI